MRIFALSDIHADYEPNMAWVHQLSRGEYVDDLLILAGDVSHKRELLDECLTALAQRFRQVLFVPGNHDLWVIGQTPAIDSLEKFEQVRHTAIQCGATMDIVRHGQLLVVPLLGWYDYSFGEPGRELLRGWTDYRACRWPTGFQMEDVAAYFEKLNVVPSSDSARMRITVSHFLPRIDLIPSFVSARHRILDPVLGTTRLEKQLRKLDPSIHVYGHSHINQSVELEGVRYVNNAFGTPQETRITAKQLVCIEEAWF